MSSAGVAHTVTGPSHSVPPRSSQLSSDGVTPVVGSSLYATREYWEARFEHEEAKEWLCGLAELAPALLPLLRGLRGGAPRLLLVGCGNSALAADLSDAGFAHVVASDFSATVVARMRARHARSHPAVRWVEADMTALDSAFARGSFDAVIDKAAMDAILADGGDRWQPRAELLAAARRVCAGVAHVLAPGGLFAQVSFSQPHFRRRFLLQPALAPPADVPATEAEAPAAEAPAAKAAADSDDEWERDLQPGVSASTFDAGGGV